MPLLKVIHNIRDFALLGQVPQPHLMVIKFAGARHHVLKNDHGRVVRDSEPFRLEILEGHVRRILANLVNCLDEGRVEYL